MLVAAPLLWAGNAVVGRALNTLIPPITLNFVRWLLAFALLLPLAWQVLRPGSRCGRTGAAMRCWACWASAATTRCSTWRCRPPRR